MKPFNLQEALAGKPVVTRAGLKVTQVVAMNGIHGGKVCVSCAYGTIRSHFADGTAGHSYDTYDLFMATTQRTVWVNLYQPIRDHSGTFSSWSSEREADEHSVKEDRLGGKAYPIVIEE